MPDQKLTYRDLLQIVELIKSSSHFSEFHLKVGDIEVNLRRSAPAVEASAVQTAAPTPRFSSAPQKRESTPQLMPAPVGKSHQRHGHIGGGELVIEPAEPVPAKTDIGHRTHPMSFPEDAFLVKSPMVGTFYRAPEPGTKPFVEVGQKVDPDTIVCIIEVMKLFNSIPAGHSGVITHILVEDGEPVEFGQVLMVIEPER